MHHLIRRRRSIKKTTGNISAMTATKGKPTTKEANRWIYAFNDDGGRWDYSYYVIFKDKKVYIIGYSSVKAVNWRERIQRIGIGDNENTVRKKFGAPPHTPYPPMCTRY
jgi:hypothetical protein